MIQDKLLRKGLFGQIVPGAKEESEYTLITPPTISVGTYTYNKSAQGPTITDSAAVLLSGTISVA